MAPPRMRGDGRKAKDPKKTFLRLLSYSKRHIFVLIAVVACIFVTAVAQANGNTALGKLVDDFILPMLESGSADFAPLVAFLAKLAGLFLLGILASWLQRFLMVGVTQGIQRTIRDEAFTKMQTLPIRYFDSNSTGNIMSRYTSDIDTMRQMISQSIPQAVSSVVTLVVLLVVVCSGVFIGLVDLLFKALMGLLV